MSSVILLLELWLTQLFYRLICATSLVDENIIQSAGIQNIQ